MDREPILPLLVTGWACTSAHGSTSLPAVGHLQGVQTSLVCVAFYHCHFFFTNGINKAKTAKNTQSKMLNAFFFFLLHDEDYGDIFEIALFEVFYFLLCEWYGVMHGCENTI